MTVDAATSIHSRDTCLLSAIAAAAAFGIVIVIVGPHWQMLDDAYYAMLADGHGLVQHPVDAIPYMHPLIGLALEIFRNVGLRPSYALFLCSLLAIVAAVIGYSVARARLGWITWVLVIGAFLSVAISLQYTAVCGLLVAAAAGLLATSGTKVPSAGLWAGSAALIWVATMLRVEMVLMAVLCLFVPLLLSAWRDGSHAPWLASFGVSCLLVVAGFLAANFITANHRLDEFYRLNNPMAVLMNYGYIEALQIFKSPLPAPYLASDIALMAHWFFADLGLMDPANVAQLTASVPVEQVLRVRYWSLLASGNSMLWTHWFWLLVGAVLISLASPKRLIVGAGIGLFAALFLASALFLKPLPERVATGMAMGLFLLAVVGMGRSAPELTGRQVLPVKLLIALLLGTLCLITASERQAVDREGKAWIADRSVLAGRERVYYFPGSLPLRSAYPPLGKPHALPVLIPLGSMYFTPEVLDGERAFHCGGFLRCLVAGHDVNVIAGKNQLQRLRTWLDERHGRRLVSKEFLSTQSFQMLTIKTVAMD